MAKGKKTGGRDFVPGQVTNPRGASAHSPAMKKLRSLTQQQLADILLEINGMTVKDLQVYAKANETDVNKVMIVSIINTVIKKGDAYMWNVMMDRIVGKVPTAVDLTSQGEPMVPKIVFEIHSGKKD